MKTFITTNTKSATGYAIEVRHDDGHIDVLPIESTVLEKKTNINWLILPTNPANRKLLNPAKMDGKTELELTYKESKTFGPRTNNSEPKKKLEDYLTDEEKSILADIMAKAKARKEADKPKPLTEVEKAKRAYEKAQAKYEALLAKAQA